MAVLERATPLVCALILIACPILSSAFAPPTLSPALSSSSMRGLLGLNRGSTGAGWGRPLLASPRGNDAHQASLPDPLRPLGGPVLRGKRAGGGRRPRMSLTVLSALSSPVVLTAAALGTLDGFGRLLVNLPRVLELQYAYASKLLERGSLDRINTDPVSFLRAKVLESSEYRTNVLRLFVKYDTDNDGLISKDQLKQALEEFPSLLKTLGETSVGEVWDALDGNQDGFIDYEEFLSLSAGDLRLSDAGQMLADAKRDLAEKSYDECKEMTSEYAKTFYLATLAMEDAKARATWAIYAWCRRVDEIVDGPTVNPDKDVQAAELDKWMARLDRMWEGKCTEGLDKYDYAFVDMLRKFPGSDIEPYRDMVRGMQMDIPDKVVYETWDDLYLYCYRVASTVGLMTLPVMGTAPGVTMEEAKDPAIALGIALQITNILRDVGEDARDRGRIYLPVEDLRRFGVTEEYILKCAKEGGPVSDEYRALMQFEIDRAREYYKRAEKGIPMLSSGAQLPVGVAAELYKEILDQLVINDYDNFAKRAYVSKEKKLLSLPALWLKTVTGGWGKDA